MNDAPSQKKSNTQWGPIIHDFLILMMIMGMLGYLCKLAMEPFEVQTPTDNLVSLIRKGDVKLRDQQLVDQPFLKELDEVSKNISKESEGVNTPDRTGRTPLMWAVYANFNAPEAALSVDEKRLYYVFSLLSTPGIDIHRKDKDGFTAMHWAAWSGLRYSLTALAHAGLDVNTRENAGYTPLMLAAMRGNDEAVAALLELGADTTLTREDGSTAADLAQEAYASYSERDSFFFSLIYSKGRSESYMRTLELLKNGKSDSPVKTDEELRRIMFNAVKESEKQSKDAAEQAAEKAEETRKELEVEKAAGAPANTSPDQAPSAQMD